MQHRLQPLAVLLPGLLLVDLVAVALRQPQEPPDGAQVLPQCAVLRARALLPAQELTQPALVGVEREGGGPESGHGELAERTRRLQHLHGDRNIPIATPRL